MGCGGSKPEETNSSSRGAPAEEVRRVEITNRSHVLNTTARGMCVWKVSDLSFTEELGHSVVAEAKESLLMRLSSMCVALSRMNNHSRTFTLFLFPSFAQQDEQTKGTEFGKQYKLGKEVRTQSVLAIYRGSHLESQLD